MVCRGAASRRRTRACALSLLRLGVVVAVAATALGGVLEAAPRGHAAPYTGAAATADSGFRDFSFGTSASAPTAKDQQSKLWFNDGTWWSSLFNRSTLKYHIHRLDTATQVWSDTGTVIDERNASRSDTFWDGSRLYVVTHGLSPTTSEDSIRLMRFTYNSTTKTYSTDAGFPVTLNTGGTQAATIDKDTTGQLWATYTQSSKVYVTHSTTGDSTWVTPYVLPVEDTTNILDQDESAIVSFNGKIGVMWSNQNANEWAYYFASHVDGAADTVWTKTTALQGSEESDNHLNVKSLDGDPAGQVFAAVKTSLNAADAPLYYLLVLRNDGTWTRQTFGTVADDHTRAQVALDPVNRRLYMFGTSPCCSGGSIYYKDTSLDSPSFASGKGTPLIQNATDTHINNPSTTKQPLTTDTELVVEASDDTSDYYLHATINIGPDVTPPDTTINSGPSGTVGTTDATFTFSANESGSTFECRLDGAAFVSCTSPKAYTGLVDGSHTFEVRATDPVGNVDPSPASRTWTIVTSTLVLTFPPEADAFVEQGKPTINFGKNTSLVADNSPNTETFIRFAPSGVTGAVVEAKLRLFVTNGTNDGPALYRSDTAWSETGVTWNTRPATVGGVIEDKAAIPNRTWTEYDVKSVVIGNGTYSFRLDPTSTDGVDFYSRESTNASKPQLVLTVDSDTIAPQTTIDSGPSGTVSSPTATFTFSSNEPGAGFRCSLDGAAYSSCGSPQSYSGLAQGLHTFGVKAVDPAGNEDLTPATRGWSIDATAPAAPVITSPPDNSTNTTGSVTVSGTAEPGTGVQILDGATLAATTTADGAATWSVTLTDVADGSHSFTARATDAAGNTSPVSNARTVTVDSTVPETTIDSGPTGAGSSTTATFTFSSDEPGASFECKLDAGAYAPCTSPQTYNDLGEGSHTFDVRATDAAGNSDATPAGRTWAVDSIAPAAPVIATPPDNSTSNTGSITVSGTAEPGVAVEVFDGPVSAGSTTADGAGAWSVALSGVADGSHTYTAKATDASTNTSAPSNATTVTVDTTAPNTTIESGPTGVTTQTSATFGFASDDAGATFACKLDGGAYAACASPQTYDGLSDGSHTFEVRAQDAGGNADPTPASRTWTVDTTAPAAPAITSPANGSTNGTGNVTLSGTAEAASTVEVFEGTTSKGTATATGGGLWSVTVSGVTEGSHTYIATATDAAGNTSAASDGVTVTVDTGAPDTTIDSGPSGNEPSSSATFTFSSSEAGSSFECSLDGGEFASCGSPTTYNSLSEGSHSFAVRATDAAGNTDASSATRSWTVDATVPTVTAVVPADGATDVLVSSDVTATFSEAMDAASITTTTFTLVVQATGTAMTADVVYDPVSRTATLNPDAPLVPATTYAATVVGGASGVKDLAGSGLAADKAWSFTTEAVPDTTPPETTIDSGPSGPTASSAATFAFSSDEAGSTFQCSLDGGVFASCTSPHSYSGLTEGSHTFRVRATDVAGNVDPTPASRTWTVDTVAPPAPSIGSPPDNSTNSTGNVTVSGTAEDDSTVELFDGATSNGTTIASGSGSWSITLTGIGDGSHAYTAKASDAAGNTSAASNARAVIVDTSAPDTTIGSGPSGPTASTTATFTFSASEGGATFQCSLDGGAYATCASPREYAGLTETSHSFAVRAKDAAGNTDQSPAGRSWTVDVTAPAAPAVTAPPDNSANTSGTIALSGTAEANSTVEVFDGPASQGTTTADGAGSWSKTLNGVGDGPHTYTAKASDAAGNTSPSSASRTVTVDASAPETTIDSGPSGTTTSRSATFTFSSNEASATFACSLDGAAFAGCASPQTYSSLTEGSHTFSVRATDALGNVDASPASRTWTIDLALFSDGFESGDFSAWTTLLTGGDGAAVVQSTTVKTGSFAAQLSETATAGSFAYARKQLDPARNELRVKGDFLIQTEGASGGNVPLFRLFDTAGTRIMSLYRQNLDANKIRVTHSGSGVTTTGRLALNTWGNFELHVLAAGTGASTVEVFQDGVLVYQTTTASLGTNPILTVQIGNDTKAQAFKLVADNILVRP